MIFGCFVFGAVATPSTDPFSMLALAAPMTVLFLAAEAIAHILDRRKAGAPPRRRRPADPRQRRKDKTLRELSKGSDDIEFDPPG